MAAECTLVPTSTRVDAITTQSLLTVTSLVPTILPPAVTKRALVPVDPFSQLSQLDQEAAPGEVTEVPVTSIRTVVLTTQQTTTLFGTVCASATASSPTPSSATIITTTTQASSSMDSSAPLSAPLSSSSDLPLSTADAIPTPVPNDTLEPSPDAVTTTITPPIAAGAAPLQTNAALAQSNGVGGLSKSQITAIIGGLGGVVVVAIIAGLLICFLKRRRQRKAEWDGLFRDNWISDGETGFGAGSKITGSPQSMRATLVPFPYDAQPAATWRDAKASISLPQPAAQQYQHQHHQGPSSTTLFAPSYNGSPQNRSGHQYATTYSDSGSINSGYGDEYAKEGSRAPDASVNSMLPNPYGGYR